MKSNDYIVLTTQRTGSSMFLDVLNGFPGYEGHMELFLDHKRKSPALAGKNDFLRYYEWKNNKYSFRPFSVWRYLSEFYSRESYLGFKLMYSHLKKYPETVPYIAYKKLKIIHLIRNNYLDIIISEKIAELTGKSHTTNSSEDNKQTIYLQPQIVLDRVKKLHSNTKFIRKLISTLKMNQSIEIYYEDILSDPDKTMDKVKNLIGIDNSTELKQSTLKKRQTKCKKDIIRNYDELTQILSNSEYNYLLNN